MKVYLFLILCFIANTVWANMASPYFDGTVSAQAFASQKVKVLNENLHILIDSNLQTAIITAEYEIETDSVGEGKFIPLLFLAERFQGEFQAWVDGQPVEWKPVPPEYIFDDFSAAFDSNRQVVIKWHHNSRMSSSHIHEFDKLKYFEAPLHKKRQTIKVSYKASCGRDRIGWVNTYVLQYAWYPALYWKSFGQINLTIESPAANFHYDINLNQTATQINPNTRKYVLNEIPKENLLIEYTPQISGTARFFIKFRPEGMAWTVAILFFIIQTLAYRPFSKQPIHIRFSFPLFMAYALISVCIMGTYLYGFPFIDNLIGKDAARYHGYYFFAVVLYPIILLFYAMLHFGGVKLLIMMRAPKR